MTTPNLALPEIAVGQAQKEVTHNEALRLLDAVVQLSVLAILSVPPGSPADGERWIIGPAATDAWAGHEGRIALWSGGWTIIEPAAGWIAWVADEAAHRTFSAGSWGGMQLQALTVHGALAAPNLPTVAPAVGSGLLWNDAGTVKVA